MSNVDVVVSVNPKVLMFVIVCMAAIIVGIVGLVVALYA